MNSFYSQDLKVGPDSLLQPKKKDFNEFDLKFTTARIGFATIYEYAAYSQDNTAKEQMERARVELKNSWEFRDFRFFANGKFNIKRPLIWKVAAMWDGSEKEWTFRETGLLIGIPELKSEVFIGRSKEGYSLNKVQNGYSTWGNERQMSLDLIPIMTDGIRWYGYLPKPRFLWSLGAFTDWIYENSRFSNWDWNYAARVGWRPIFTNGEHRLMHLGVNFRYARPDEGQIQVRSRPESNPAPYFIDTGKFKADLSSSIGGEAYYSTGPLLVGTEFNWHNFRSFDAGNPTYFGWSINAGYIFTGEKRPYLSNNSVFYFVEPNRSVLKGGPGGIELMLQLSSFNLNEGLKPGGSFWKFTPIINWYVHKYFRIELVYGYGVLDRFQMKGGTHFFQTRFQLQIM